jgi:hypothetical protein
MGLAGRDACDTHASGRGVRVARQTPAAASASVTRRS